MRKALLVVALIAASFAGGAAVNGPGLSWAKELLGTMMRGGAPSRAEDAAPVAVDEPIEAFPAAPLPGLSDPPTKPEDPPAAASTAPAQSAASPPAAAPEGVKTPPPAAPPAPAAEVPAPPAPTSASPDNPALPKFEPAPVDPGIAPAPAADNPPAPAAAPDRAGPVAWSDAPDSTAPAPAVVPGRPVSGPVPGAKTRTDPALTQAGSPAQSGGSGWADVRRRMKDLGVSRYWIEGEPAGAVRFRCVIPLAGERAVSQQFEAEADDEIQAAEAALKRVALWRAVEGR
jgi:hypothetical protein